MTRWTIKCLLDGNREFILESLTIVYKLREDRETISCIKLAHFSVFSDHVSFHSLICWLPSMWCLLLFWSNFFHFCCLFCRLTCLFLKLSVCWLENTCWLENICWTENTWWIENICWLNEFPDLYDVQIFMMICINDRIY